ncbi:hypothetical protein A3J17_00630 [Candidatus Curtissbacteria bacterium RIFCSPLOWO2_02_FULL_40_11]|uniref:DNA-directed DNA polymerase n=1 Tax=Candidatus Curtissbacteria bacterium RIFCSPHIGHO2_02_FULL_40_16b TaxID=1797714 RepID=A0A1F5G836_9BACT|nr:MAG: hypothetical protein A3D04_03100 [Candidatus Curtissbacteria bacterium RIFCSPHIGHO2_02_FULL_40_16b]OGE01561.1 MAG: hypothetical protein A3J17_00630 [Candidatus Curtissbacteria bacterium RIFCSPLOWO2_02_FULL_40_11]
MKYFSNKDIAKLLKEISAAYEAKGENRFKVVAYDSAATSIEHATSELKDLWEEDKLNTIPGLGKSIQEHLEELFKTGKVKHFDSVKKSLPQGMFPLLDIGGLGPKSAYKLARELNVKNVEDLKRAAKEGKISKLSGFGEKSEEEILTAIAELSIKTTNRYLLTEAFPVAERVLKHLRSHKDCERAEPLGSLRRMVATVGDIDIAVASKNPKAIIEHFKKFKEISRLLDAGPRKSSALLLNGMQVDLLASSPRAFGALLQHFTGSKNHNVHLREYAISKKMSVSDYGIKAGGKLHEFKTEEEFYRFLGMDFIEPELREDSGEIEAALFRKLPKVIEVKDIKGDIHLHSNYPIEPSHDFGKDSFEAIVKRAKELDYEYIGFSDHSPGFSTHSEAQIIKLINRRKDKIEQLKTSSKNIKVLNLLEIDILTNGQLSVPEEGLKLLDGTIAGIHSSHRHNKHMITKRLMTAISSPYVQVISHPTGRLLNQRESYDADWPKVFEACSKSNTLLEINACPNRLDLTDTLIREAIKRGVKLMINTDAHDLKHMDNMRFGVAVARRGWAEKKHIANTLPWVEFRKIFRV